MATEMKADYCLVVGVVHSFASCIAIHLPVSRSSLSLSLTLLLSLARSMCSQVGCGETATKVTGTFAAILSSTEPDKNWTFTKASDDPIHFRFSLKLEDSLGLRQPLR